MDHLSHNEGVIGVGGQVAANGLRGFAAGTTAAVAATPEAPAGVEEVSAHAMAAFAAENAQATALNAIAQEEIARLGAHFIEITNTYTTTDGANAVSL